MNSAAWDRLVSSQIDPGHSLEEYDIFESVRGFLHSFLEKVRHST